MTALKRLAAIVVLFLALYFFLAFLSSAKQTQPDPKRIKQIQIALVDHGYQAGQTWKQTQEILRCIAGDHHWQTHRAPDARVLILLGLGNAHSDPAVALEEHNHLDGGSDE